MNRETLLPNIGFIKEVEIAENGKRVCGVAHYDPHYNIVRLLNQKGIDELGKLQKEKEANNEILLGEEINEILNNPENFSAFPLDGILSINDVETGISIRMLKQDNQNIEEIDGIEQSESGFVGGRTFDLLAEQLAAANRKKRD